MVWRLQEPLTSLSNTELQEKGSQVAEQMRNFICRPSSILSNPCTTLNDIASPIERATECAQVKRTNQGDDPTLLELENVRSYSHCIMVDETCQVREAFSALYPTNAPTPFPSTQVTARPTFAERQLTQSPTPFPTFVFTQRPTTVVTAFPTPF